MALSHMRLSNLSNLWTAGMVFLLRISADITSWLTKKFRMA